MASVVKQAHDAAVDTADWWDDETFQDRLVALLTYDIETLRTCSALLTAEDFRPIRGITNGQSRWIVAERALAHYTKHREPLGALVRADVTAYGESISLGASRLTELRDYTKHLATVSRAAPNAIVEKVVQYKSARLKASALQEMTDLQNAGQLTDDRWREITARALVTTAPNTTTDYLATLEDRMERRAFEHRRLRVPWTLIDPLDSMVRTVGRKQLGLIIGPYKRGKSSMLLWLAGAYVIQRLNVLYVTLEDPQDLVEDRLDAIITQIPIKSLTEYPQTLRRRFARYKTMMRTRLKIFDGTLGGVSVATINETLERERDQGFLADAVLVDYDKWLVAPRRRGEKREEIDDTYREMQVAASRWNQIWWTGAQTQRNTRNLKILSGDVVADDINKVRNVACAISMGKGEWADDAIYLWVAAHKYDHMDVGCEIVPDLKRMLIYDREATRRAAAANGAVEEGE